MADEALDAIVERYADTTGIRDLEQAAEHIAANALYQIEVDHKQSVTFVGQWSESYWIKNRLRR